MKTGTYYFRCPKCKHDIVCNGDISDHHVDIPAMCDNDGCSYGLIQSDFDEINNKAEVSVIGIISDNYIDIKEINE